MKLFCKFCHRMVEPLDGYYYKKCPVCYHALPKDPNRWLIYISVMFGIITILCMALSSAYSATATISTTSTIGTIRGDFYGVYGESWGSNLSWIDTDKNNVLETLSNYTWHREKMIEAGIIVRRTDMNLVGIVQQEGVYNSTRTLNNNGNILQKQDLVNNAYANGQKILFIANTVPNWLANKTEGWCQSANETCPPTNYTKWTNMLVGYLNLTNCGLYQSTCYVEAWNEPNLDSYFMRNVSDRTNINISTEYNKICNATLAIKNTYPNIKVGCGSTTVTSGRDEINRGVLGNFSNQIDFFSIHFYKLTSNSEPIASYYQREINNVNANLTAYGFTGQIIVSEIGNQNSTIMNATDSSEFKKDYAVLYTLFLNQPSRNYSVLPYMWAGRSNYSVTRTETKRWEMVAEPLLDNQLYGNFNITKLFANNHKAGNTVLNSSSNDTQLKVVASKDAAGKYYITLTNTNSTSVNVTLSFTNTLAAPSGYYTYLRNVENNEYYNLTDNRVTIHDISGYGVMTLRGDYTILTTTQLCLDTLSGFEEFGSWIVILIIVSVAGFLIFMLMGEDVNMDFGALSGLAVAVIIAAICFGIGSVIIAQLNPGC